MMQMSFSWALPVTILFDSWVASTPAQLGLACGAFVALGAARHALGVARAEAAALALAPARAGGGGDVDDGGGDAAAAAGKGGAPGGGGGGGGLLRSLLPAAALRRSPALARALDAALYAASLLVSYVNMLAVMTYNPALLLAVVAGETLGLLALAPARGAPGGALRAALLAAAEEEEEGCCK